MPIVSLSGLTGGGARKLGPEIAERLGADYVDRLILTRAAREIGATVEALHDREERIVTRGERFLRIVQKVLERSAVTSASGDPYFGSSAVALLTEEFEELPQPRITQGHELDDSLYIKVLTDIVHSLAKTGNVVIVGRGSPYILKDVPTALRVGTIAEWDDRVERVMDIDQLTKEDAERTIKARDDARGDYYKRYFNIDDPDAPSLYHLVINTSTTSNQYAIELVVQASIALEAGRLN